VAWNDESRFTRNPLQLLVIVMVMVLILILILISLHSLHLNSLVALGRRQAPLYNAI
jgi:hypothetical protein